MAISGQDLANMTDSSYIPRLSSFVEYVYDYMSAEGYIDFADDLPSVIEGAYGWSELCPVQ